MPSHVAGETKLESVCLHHDRGRSQHVAGVVTLELHAGRNILFLTQRRATKELECILGVDHTVQGRAFAVVSAYLLAILSPAVAELGVFLLDERGIREHRQTQIDGCRRRVDGAGISIAYKRRQIAAMVNVCVRKDHAIDAGDGKRKLAIAFPGLLASPLIQAAVE